MSDVAPAENRRRSCSLNDRQVVASLAVHVITMQLALLKITAISHARVWCGLLLWSGCWWVLIIAAVLVRHLHTWATMHVARSRVSCLRLTADAPPTPLNLEADKTGNISRSRADNAAVSAYHVLLGVNSVAYSVFSSATVGGPWSSFSGQPTKRNYFHRDEAVSRGIVHILWM